MTLTTRNPSRTAAALLLGATALVAASAAQAATLVGLTADNRLVRIDTATMAASAPMAINGEGKVVGIDMRPADGKLYALTADGAIWALAADTGMATPVSKLSEKVDLGPKPVVDFNPAADRLRVIAKDGVSLRIVVETGQTFVDKPLNYDAADANAGKKPMVAAGAYTNSMAGSKATELYHVDAATGALVLQASPNDGVLKTKGMVGMPVPAGAVMDIGTDAMGKNTAYLVAGGVLHTIDLATGKATAMGRIKGLSGDLVDIAVAAP